MNRQPHSVVGTAYAALDYFSDDYFAGGRVIIDYSGLAKRLGVYTDRRNLRWIGSVTDLLDAACCRADKPAIALYRVRQAGGNVNARSWKHASQAGYRDAIIKKAAVHKWTKADFAAVREALDFLVALPPDTREDGWTGPNATAWHYCDDHGTVTGRTVKQWAMD
jgi:hypothetical protein